MRICFVHFAIGASGLRLSSPPDLGTHDTRWRVVLSTRYENNIVEPIMLTGTYPTKAKTPKSCGGVAPGRRTILMSCNDGELCLEGRGFETRVKSTVEMIREAVNSLRRRGITIRTFGVRKIAVGDMASGCDYDYAYALPWNTAETCKTQLFPDFTFVAWKEAGLLPDFTSLTNSLHGISKTPSEKQVCGWAGNPRTNGMRKEFVKLASPSLFEVVTPRINTGTGGGRITMEAQTQQWACMVDLPGAGYSGRVPMLLHAGRPVLMVERDKSGHFTDRVWYADMLKPNLHYIPVNHDFSNLDAAARKAISEEGLNIAANAQRLAANNLTKVAAIGHIATLLAGI